MGYENRFGEIPRRLRGMLERLGIKTAFVSRRTFGEDRKKSVLEELEEKAKKLSTRLDHISDEEVAALIRENRECR
jgi:hypothetical protein